MTVRSAARSLCPATLAVGIVVFFWGSCRKGSPDRGRRDPERKGGPAATRRDGSVPSRAGAGPVSRAGQASRAGPVSRAAVLRAMHRGVEALCRIPDKDLRHDTALGLAHVRRLVPVAPDRFGACLERINRRALRDHDHPLNFMILPSRRRSGPALKRHIASLPIPKAGQKRTNVNHMVIRAAYCREVDFPEEAFAYVVGPMRDNGGFHSTHAMWALLMLREQGCRTGGELDLAIASVQQELLSAQKKGLDLKSTASVDLYAERILFLARSGVPSAVTAPQAARLLAAQRPDGLFAAPNESEPRWLVHSTTVSVWALARFLSGPK